MGGLSDPSKRSIAVVVTSELGKCLIEGVVTR